MNLHKKYRTLLKNSGIDTKLRLAHFFAQLEHESNLKPVSENLNYSAVALLSVFSRHFIDISHAKLYARQPKKIANRVYANRMENGSESSGDGWKFRGRGFIQITGKRNYRLLSKDTGIDYLNHPDKLLTEADSMISALWFWNRNNLNRFADKDDVNKLTRAINGGYNGLAHRKKLLRKYKTFFK